MGGGLIEAPACAAPRPGLRRCSASLGGGLIEAESALACRWRCWCVPPLWEAASLKPDAESRARQSPGGVPPLWEAASLKPVDGPEGLARRRRCSASLGGGLIEAAVHPFTRPIRPAGVPPLWEAASLKPFRRIRATYTAPCVPPLWEAASLKRRGVPLSTVRPRRVPPLWEAASLKHGQARNLVRQHLGVFRLFGRRPH